MPAFYVHFAIKRGVVLGGKRICEWHVDWRNDGVASNV